MKTPRDILFARHQAAQPKLDAVRRAVVLELNNSETKKQSSENSFVTLFLRCSKAFWNELILPSRRTWAGLATVWVLLAVTNLAQRESVPAGEKISIPMRINFTEQQRLMNELFADRSLPMDTDRPKTFSPKPRTETFQTITV
jgi:hypothetical protein